MNTLDAHILVVDDVEDNRNILVRRLRRLGYRTIAEAGDGAEALEHIRAQACDLVLLDVMMPNVNGVDVLRTLKAENRLETVSVIMISAATEIDTVVACIELGAEDYLPKPFNAAILRARIGSVLEKKFLRAALSLQLQRLEAEMAVARRQQMAMVPTEFTIPCGRVGLHAIMRPALEVGGDLYDFFHVTPDILCVAIGDVSGKGMPAALFMARTRSLLRAGVLQHFRITGEPPPLPDLAQLLNEELCKNNESSLFVTLIVGFVHLASGSFHFANAGHLRPLLLRAGSVSEIAGSIGPPLGAMDDSLYAEDRVTLMPGDVVAFITDGLSEMEDPARAMYSAERLQTDMLEIGGEDVRAMAEQFVARVLDHAGPAAPSDDVTVLTLRLH